MLKKDFYRDAFGITTFDNTMPFSWCQRFARRLKKGYNDKEVEKAYVKEKVSPMSLQGYLLGLKISALLAFFAWASVVLYIDPDASGAFGSGLFFGTLFLWLSGILAVLLTWLQRKIFGDERAAEALGSNMRQSVLIAFAVLVLLTLRYFKVMAFWNVLLVVAAVLLIELYFTHYSRKIGSENPGGPASRSRMKQRRLI